MRPLEDQAPGLRVFRRPFLEPLGEVGYVPTPMLPFSSDRSSPPPKTVRINDVCEIHRHSTLPISLGRRKPVTETGEPEKV